CGHLQRLRSRIQDFSRKWLITSAFAKAGESKRTIFHKIDDHTIGSNHLNSFNLQGLSNTVWAFAKVEESNPRLFQKVADHISRLSHLNSINS
ncbi:hypothetical protein ACHAWF_009258, partial [Thalassiosira exigua]